MKVELPGFAGGDRTSLDLPKAQQLLLERMEATGKPLIVVLFSGSALAVNWAQQHAVAIIQAWYPGEEGGTAIADTIAGKNNPGGRLPVTFYTGIEQLPHFENYDMTGRTYRFFHGQPLYPFGFGLSYTSFAYGDLQLSTNSLAAGQKLSVGTRVTNTGDREGDEAQTNQGDVGRPDLVYRDDNDRDRQNEAKQNPARRPTKLLPHAIGRLAQRIALRPLTADRAPL